MPIELKDGDLYKNVMSGNVFTLRRDPEGLWYLCRKKPGGRMSQTLPVPGASMAFALSANYEQVPLRLV